MLKHFDHIQRSLTKKVLIDYDQILAATNNLVDEEMLEEIAKLIDNSKRVYFYGSVVPINHNSEQFIPARPTGF